MTSASIINAAEAALSITITTARKIQKNYPNVGIAVWQVDRREPQVSFPGFSEMYEPAVVLLSKSGPAVSILLDYSHPQYVDLNWSAERCQQAWRSPITGLV